MISIALPVVVVNDGGIKSGDLVTVVLVVVVVKKKLAEQWHIN